nr:DNA polymerase III [Rhodomonas sp. NIES-1006]
MNQNYVPFHLKYRPQNFTNIIGQSEITQYLELAIKEKKIAFAYLFTGQHGSGKTTLARITAKALNCTSKHDVPCNTCENCINIHSGASFDVYEIDAAKNTGIENIREIIDNMQFAPMISQYKVCIIDEAHMLSNSAFNSLLKTLESPPRHTIFILSTTNVKKIPNTILSRCQKLYFQPIKTQDLVIAISKVVHNEKLKITNKAMMNLITISKGSFRDALSIVELFSIGTKNITEKSISDRYFIPSTIIVETLIEKILSFNILETLIIIDYIKAHNWNPDVVGDLMYTLLVQKYINNRQLNVKKQSFFCNTRTLLTLLKILANNKSSIEKECWQDIILFVIRHQTYNTKIKTNKRKKTICKHLSRMRIRSN